MKAGFTISALAHVTLLAGAMVSLAAPKPLSAPDVEALPIDIVPFEELTKSVQGDKKAEPKQPPAPKATVEPPKVEQAVNVGDTDVDKKADAPKKAPAPPVEKTEAPTPEPAPRPVEKPVSVPTPKLAPEPEPKKDIALLLKENAPEQPDTTEPAEEAFEKLPQKVATPKKRPAAPKPEIAKTNDRKKTEQKEAQAKESKKKKTDATKKAVVNKADANAGGAKRSKKKAGLGTKKASNSTRLAQSEIDAIRGRLEGCWSVGDLTGHPDAATMRAQAVFKLTQQGDIDGRVKVKVTGTDRSTKATLAVRVRSAVIECAPYSLPTEKYDSWSNVTVNFSLQDML